MKNIKFIGKVVNVTIDRPINSIHPKHKDIIYQVNYGYISGEFSGDSEELDAYVLGVTEEIKIFEGVCIAIIHRLHEDDDKLIVVPLGLELSDKQIKEMTYFQERFFESEILRN